MAKCDINGKSEQLSGYGDMPLLWFLREKLQLTGTKFGCGIGSCGACTVHIDGQAIRSCTIPIKSLAEKRVVTIEGLATNPDQFDKLHPVQRVWIELNVAQCGYCQAGQIMAVVEFLGRFPKPTDEDIDTHLTNLCRCGTYTRMRKAIHHAAKMIRLENGELL